MISETHEELGDIVAAVYRKVDWKKITSKKRSAVDILTDRLRVASHEKDILRATEKLCSSLHVPYAKLEPGQLETLHEKNKDAMNILREHTGYVAVLAQKKAKEAIAEAKNNEN
jgi:hypothetical protein